MRALPWAFARSGTAASKGSAGSGPSVGRSASAICLTVASRPAMWRASSERSAASSSAFSSARLCTRGTGTRWRRRKRPTSPSTPPFSCAPAMPGSQKKLSKP